MNKVFEEAIEEVLKYEGGYVNDPTDPGGETKYGIAKRFYPDLDIKNLTKEQAKEIYYKDYWKTKHIDLDKVAEFEPKIAKELFDIGVNQGLPTAAKYLQESLNLMNRNEKLFPDLKIDGYAGNKTMGCIGKLRDWEKLILLKIINGLQFKRYYDIVNKNPKMEKYFVGWMKRV
jgi:lysozyme family protein